MNEEQISMVDPSLPLADTSLAPPLPSRQVRFVPAEPPDPPPDQEFLPSWQVDGSIENSSGTFQAHYTMREYDDQLNTMKKENLNLKLRSELTFPIIFIIFVLKQDLLHGGETGNVEKYQQPGEHLQSQHRSKGSRRGA